MVRHSHCHLNPAIYAPIIWFCGLCACWLIMPIPSDLEWKRPSMGGPPPLLSVESAHWQRKTPTG